MNKTKEEVCAETILDYLIKQNRPYSVTDVQTNLHNEFGKSAVSKALDYLSSRGKIRAKTYNKQVVYVADQNHMPTVDYSELKVMDSNILAASERIKLVNDECKILENALHQLNVEETNEEADIQLRILVKECDDLRTRLSSLKSCSNVVSQKEKNTIAEKHSTYYKEWKKRKRMCNEMLNVIMENYPKTKKALLEEAGIETDEDVGIDSACINIS